MLDFTLSARPAVYIVWIAFSLLAIPMFMFAPNELAPTEDQSFMMSIIEAPADATIDQTVFYTEAVNRELMKVPEANRTFQITFPDNGLAGLVLKPWGERKRTRFQSDSGGAETGERNRRHPDHARHAARLAWRRSVPGRNRDRRHCGAGRDSGIRRAIAAESRRQRHVRLSADHRYQSSINPRSSWSSIATKWLRSV